MLPHYCSRLFQILQRVQDVVQIVHELLCVRDMIDEVIEGKHSAFCEKIH
jgi:hypothetical protein